MEPTPFGAARLLMLETDAAGAKAEAEPEDAGRGGAMAGDVAWLTSAAAAASSFNLAPADVYVAAEVAAMESASLDRIERRALVMILFALRAALQRGSTRIPATGAEGTRAFREFARDWTRAIEESNEAHGRPAPAMDDPDDLARAAVGVLEGGRAGDIVGGPDDARPLVLSGEYVYLERLHHHEARLVARLAGRASGAAIDSDAAIRAAVDEAVRASPVPLTDEQERAVVLAATSRFGTISGGPGTGKTSIVVAILRALAALGLSPEDVAVAAPTGKAAKRLEESIASALANASGADDRDDLDVVARTIQPRTLHRLLGYRWGADRFRHGADNVLPFSAVIVDEASMIDITMMSRLVDAVSPDARLICLGDADQLPSVEAGAVFKDLNEALPEHGVKLRKSFRMRSDDADGRHVLTIARAVNAGDVRGALGDVGSGAEDAVRQRGDDEAIAFRGVEARFRGIDERGLDAFLGMWFARRIANFADWDRVVSTNWSVQDGMIAEPGPASDLLAHYAGAKVLSVTRHLASGIERVNAMLHHRLMRATGAPAGLPMAAGDPIVVDRNDYQRGLYNGDQGVLLRTADRTGRPRLSAVFVRDDGLRAFPLVALRQHLSLGYAQTVHKSQGSEFDHVAVFLPPYDVPLLTREILYTAITRARKSVVIVGEATLFATGVERKLVRHTGLIDRLR